MEQNLMEMKSSISASRKEKMDLSIIYMTST